MELSKDLAVLVDELIDAHDDTVRLSEGPATDWQWEAHLCYVRELRRLGSEALAAAKAACCQRRSSRFRSSFQRRGERRCARNGHGQGLA
jgi:hypothetical protein